MIGLSESLAADLAARGYTDSDVAQLFAPLAYRGEVSVVYSRPNGDRTSPLPSSLHRYCTTKGFTAVEIIDPPADTENAESVVPDVILDHGRNDRVGTWTRGDGLARVLVPQRVCAVGEGMGVRRTERRETPAGGRGGTPLAAGRSRSRCARRSHGAQARVRNRRGRTADPCSEEEVTRNQSRDGWTTVARIATSRWSYLLAGFAPATR